MRLGIFPAAGALGGATLSSLVHSTGTDPKDVVLISRNPEKLAAENAKGVTTRKANFDEEASLIGVFEGIDALNLISYPSFQHEYRFKVAKAAIDSAIDSGVKHIFYSSLAFAREGEPFFRPDVMKAHLDTEAYLASLVSPSFSYTNIRQGLYSESFSLYTANFDIVAASKSQSDAFTIKVPHSGGGHGLAWAKREELGEATANLMHQYAQNPSTFPYTNKLVILSGPRAYSLNETAEVLSKVLGKPVTIQQVSVDEFAHQKGVGYANDDVESNKSWATAYEAIKHGEAATVTDTLRKALGREPEDFESTLRGMLA